MKPPAPAPTRSAPTLRARMNHDPDYLPPPPKQPLPPGKQPSGPMPDQDLPPAEPHHLPDDPVAPQAGDFLREGFPRGLHDLSSAALGARIPL